MFLHHLYCQDCLQENLRFNSFYEASFSWGCSVSINLPYAHVWNTVATSGFLVQQVPLPFSCGRSTHYSDRLHDFSVTIPRCYKDVYVNSFFPPTVRFWNSQPLECFHLIYDLSGFKSRINRHLLTTGSF